MFSKETAKRIYKKLKLDVDFDEFHAGLNVELEHGTKGRATNITNDDPVLTANIALAHLNEIPDYYTRLKKMEDSAKLDINKAYERFKVAGFKDAVKKFLTHDASSEAAVMASRAKFKARADRIMAGKEMANADSFSKRLIAVSEGKSR